MLEGGKVTGEYTDAKTVYESVKNYYGKVLNTSKDLKTNACCTNQRPHPIIAQALKDVPEEIISKYYGCGTPIPFGIEGLKVLDLGSGSGRDCYVAARLVGPSGYVTGIDMTEEQLSTARTHISEYMKKINHQTPNIRFITGYIELLGELNSELTPNSIDLVISNCVLNLSPDKLRVLKNVHSILRNGGEFFFSDVYCDRRLPENVRNHPVLFGECISGALYIQDFKRLCHKVGFLDPRVYSLSSITIGDPELQSIVGQAKFYSITYRLFKLNNLETLCEDYGQYAVYKGTIKGSESFYKLDDGHSFEAGKVYLVCGNTASMLEDSWLSKHFKVVGNRDIHYGLFKDCGPSENKEMTDSSCCS